MAQSATKENDRQDIVASLQQGVFPALLVKQYGVSVSSIHKLRAQAKTRLATARDCNEKVNVKIPGN